MYFPIPTRRFARWSLAVLAITLLYSYVQPRSFAQEKDKAANVQQVQTLQEAVDGIANRLSRALKSNEEKDVVVGTIDIDGSENTITAPLIKAFKAQGINVLDGAQGSGKFRVNGEAFQDDLGGGKVMLTIKCQLKPPRGRNRTYAEFAITSPDEIIQLVGTTGDLPVESREKREEAVQVQLKEPEFVVQETEASPPPKQTPVSVQVVDEKSVSIIQPSKASPYKVELLVQRGGKGPYVPLPVIFPDDQKAAPGVVKGRPSVDLKAGDNYALRIINASKIGAGIEVSIDGVNIFEFSEIKPWRALGKLYFHPGQQHIVSGWHFHNGPGGTRKFNVVKLPVDFEKLLGSRRSKVGLISVRFYSAWPKGQRPPSDEPTFLQGSGLHTQPGQPDLEAKGYGTSGPKVFGALRSQITIRYSRPTPPPDLPPG